MTKTLTIRATDRLGNRMAHGRIFGDVLQNMAQGGEEPLDRRGLRRGPPQEGSVQRRDDGLPTGVESPAQRLERRRDSPYHAVIVTAGHPSCEAAKQLGPDAKVVTVFCDRMERYFSTELFTGMAKAQAGVCCN